MCDPTAIIGLAGGATQIAGQVMRGRQASDLSGLQARIGQVNADSLNTQADIALEGVDLAFAKERVVDARISREGDAALSAQTNLTTARHFDPTFGSPLVLQAFTAGQVKADLDIARAGAEIEAADAYARSASLRGAALGALGNVYGAQLRGSAAQMASYFGAGTAFLNTLGKLNMPGRGGAGTYNPFAEAG